MRRTVRPTQMEWPSTGGGPGGGYDFQQEVAEAACQDASFMMAQWFEDHAARVERMGFEEASKLHGQLAAAIALHHGPAVAPLDEAREGSRLTGCVAAALMRMRGDTKWSHRMSDVSGCKDLLNEFLAAGFHPDPHLMRSAAIDAAVGVRIASDIRPAELGFEAALMGQWLRVGQAASAEPGALSGAGPDAALGEGPLGAAWESRAAESMASQALRLARELGSSKPKAPFGQSGSGKRVGAGSARRWEMAAKLGGSAAVRAAAMELAQEAGQVLGLFVDGRVGAGIAGQALRCMDPSKAFVPDVFMAAAAQKAIEPALAAMSRAAVAGRACPLEGEGGQEFAQGFGKLVASASAEAASFGSFVLPLWMGEPIDPVAAFGSARAPTLAQLVRTFPDCAGEAWLGLAAQGLAARDVSGAQVEEACPAFVALHVRHAARGSQPHPALAAVFPQAAADAAGGARQAVQGAGGPRSDLSRWIESMRLAQADPRISSEAQSRARELADACAGRISEISAHFDRLAIAGALADAPAEPRSNTAARRAAL